MPSTTLVPCRWRTRTAPDRICPCYGLHPHRRGSRSHCHPALPLLPSVQRAPVWAVSIHLRPTETGQTQRPASADLACCLRDHPALHARCLPETLTRLTAAERRMNPPPPACRCRCYCHRCSPCCGTDGAVPQLHPPENCPGPGPGPRSSRVRAGGHRHPWSRPRLCCRRSQLSDRLTPPVSCCLHHPPLLPISLPLCLLPPRRPHRIPAPIRHHQACHPWPPS